MKMTSGTPPHLRAVVARGRSAGTVLLPHLHHDGCFVVSMVRNERDGVRVRTVAEAIPYLQGGYGLRMSPGGFGPSSRLIRRASISGWS